MQIVKLDTKCNKIIMPSQGSHRPIQLVTMQYVGVLNIKRFVSSVTRR